MPKYYYEQIIRKRLAWILMYKQINNVSKGCLHFGISRKRFYKWLKRYEGSGGDPPFFGWEERKPHVLTVRKTHKPSENHPWRRFNPEFISGNEDIHKKKKRDYY